jgi:hypothetical protein
VIRYAHAHWRALTRYVDDGLLEINNSAAERALRAVALGRKNYLSCGSNSGGELAAAIYSWWVQPSWTEWIPKVISAKS